MRDIGRVVGVHAGSLYVHINSKMDLLEAIILSIMEQSERDMSEVIAAGGPAREQLRLIAEKDLELITSHHEAATVFFHAACARLPSSARSAKRARTSSGT